MEIKEIEFGPKKYLAIRQTIQIANVSDSKIYDSAGKKLGAFLSEKSIAPTGPWSALYFKWDEEAGEADMAIAFPVENADVEGTEFTLIEIAKTPASLVEMQGDYVQLKNVHSALSEYSKENHFQPAMGVQALEEYLVGPMQDQKSENWITHIYHLHN